MSEFVALSVSSIKSSLRSGGELFWNIFFIIILFLVFTSMNFEGPPAKIFIQGKRSIEGVQVVSDPEKADAIVKIEGDRIIVIYRNPDEVVRMKVRSAIWKLKESLERQGRESYVIVEKIRLGRKINYKGFITTGILTMLLFSTGAFGAVKVLSFYRYTGVLKMLFTFPLKKIIVYTSLSASSFFQAVLGVSIVLILSKPLNVNLEMNIPMFLLSFFVIFFSSYAFGAIIALLVRTPKGASGIVSILYTLMPFFSGVYFPVEFLPSSLRWVSILMPMKYMVELMRKAIS